MLIKGYTIFQFVWFMLFFITLAKFMFLCVWKHIPQMNDNLIARIAISWAGFLSIWMSLTGFQKTDSFCLGEYNLDSKFTFDWQDIVAPKYEDLPRYQNF